MEKAREFQKKTSTFASLTVLNPLTLCYTRVCGSVGHKKLWEILRDGSTRPPYLSPEKPICRSRSKLELDGKQLTSAKGIQQGCILSPRLFKLYAEYIRWNARLNESQAGIKISRRNINNLRYVDDTILVAESEEELKSLLMRVKEENEKLA